MLKYPEVKRAWIVGDIHLGIRAASMDWFDISKIYFEQYLLPLIEKNYKEGDVLIQLGDLFENRQTINLKFNSYAIEIFQRIGKILPVFIICGNHDIYYKKTNEVTSLDSIKYIPNIYLFKQPEMIKFGKTDCLMMPWRADYKEEGETLDQFPNAEFVFCHSEMQGVMLNRKSVQHEGTKVSKFKNYRRVYSGHIHYSQTVKNVVMVGNAYQMTRSDHNNPLSEHLIMNKSIITRSRNVNSLNRLRNLLSRLSINSQLFSAEIKRASAESKHKTKNRNIFHHQLLTNDQGQEHYKPA